MSTAEFVNCVLPYVTHIPAETYDKMLECLGHGPDCACWADDPDCARWAVSDG